MKTIVQLIFALVLASLLTGCATPYMVDRGRDAKDVVNLCIGYGVGAKARVGPLHIGAVAHKEKGGLRGGMVHWAKESYDHHVEIHLLLIGYDAFYPVKDPLNDVGTWSGAYGSFFPEIQPWQWRSAGARRKGYHTLHSIITPPGVYGGKGGDLNQIYSRAYYSQIDCVIGFGPSVRVGFNPGEFVDLLLGFFGVDIYSDDLERRRQKTERPPAGAVPTGAAEE